MAEPILTVVCPSAPAGERLSKILSAALQGRAFQRVSWLTDSLLNRRILFAAALPAPPPRSAEF